MRLVPSRCGYILSKPGSAPPPARRQWLGRARAPRRLRARPASPHDGSGTGGHNLPAAAGPLPGGSAGRTAVVALLRCGRPYPRREN